MDQTEQIKLIQDGLNKFKQDFFNFRQEQQQQQDRRALYDLLFAGKKYARITQRARQSGVWERERPW